MSWNPPSTNPHHHHDLDLSSPPVGRNAYAHRAPAVPARTSRRKYTNGIEHIGSGMPRTNASARVNARRPNLAFKSRKRAARPLHKKTHKKGAKKTGARRRATKTPSRDALIRKMAAPVFVDLSITETFTVPADTTADGRGVLWTVPDGFTVGSAANAVNQGTYDVNHLGLLASRLDTTQIQPGGATLTTGLSNFLYEIVKCSVQHQLMNMSTGQANLTIFKCQVRRDLPNTAAYASPVTILGNGWIQNGVAVPANGNYAMSPFQSPLFCSAYKILKVKSYVFEPGQQITISLKQGHKRVAMQHFTSVTAQAQTWQTAAYDFVAVKGSEFYLMKWSGQLQDFTTVSAGPGYTAPKIFCTSTIKYEIKAAAYQKEFIYKVNLGTVVGATPQIVDPLTGVIETGATAPQNA